MTRSASPARPARGFTLVEILVVISILAALIGMVSAVIPKAIASKNRLVCQNNLRNLGALLLEQSASRGISLKAGQGLLLKAYVDGLVKKGDEKLFLCPFDMSVRGQDPSDPAFLRRYAAVDLAHPDPEICSYLVRDGKRFPLRPGSDRKEPIALCPFHGDGVMVLYEDGSVVFLDRAALGIPAGDPVVVGPDSPAEVLRMFPAR